MFQHSDRKRSLGERSHTSPRILLLNGKNKDGLSEDGMSSPETGSKVLRGTEKRRSLKSVKIIESDNEDMTKSESTEQQPKIQDRPLPQIPPVSKDK